MSDALPSLYSVDVQVIVHEIIKNALQFGSSGIEHAKIQTLQQLAVQLTQVEIELGAALGKATGKLLEISEQSVQRHLQNGEGLWEFLFGVRPSVAERRARTHVLALHQQLVDAALSYTDRLMARKLQFLGVVAQAEQQREIAVERMLQHLLPNAGAQQLLADSEIRVEGCRTTPIRILRSDE